MNEDLYFSNTQFFYCSELHTDSSESTHPSVVLGPACCLGVKQCNLGLIGNSQKTCDSDSVTVDVEEEFKTLEKACEFYPPSEEPTYIVKTYFTDAAADAPHTISAMFPLFQAQWSPREDVRIKEDYIEAEPEKHQTPRERFRQPCAALARKHLDRAQKYFEYRREHLKVKSAKGNFLDETGCREAFNTEGVTPEGLSEVIRHCLGLFLDGLFSMEELTRVESLSLRHTCMGCLVDGYFIYGRLLSDLSEVCASFSFPGACLPQFLQWRLLFLERIRRSRVLLEVCERAVTNPKATSKSAEGVRTLYLELQGWNRSMRR